MTVPTSYPLTVEYGGEKLVSLSYAASELRLVSYRTARQVADSYIHLVRRSDLGVPPGRDVVYITYEGLRHLINNVESPNKHEFLGQVKRELKNVQKTVDKPLAALETRQLIGSHEEIMRELRRRSDIQLDQAKKILRDNGVTQIREFMTDTYRQLFRLTRQQLKRQDVGPGAGPRKTDTQAVDHLTASQLITFERFTREFYELLIDLRSRDDSTPEQIAAAWQTAIYRGQNKGRAMRIE